MTLLPHKCLEKITTSCDSSDLLKSWETPRLRHRHNFNKNEQWSLFQNYVAFHKLSWILKSSSFINFDNNVKRKKNIYLKYSKNKYLIQSTPGKASFQKANKIKVCFWNGKKVMFLCVPFFCKVSVSASLFCSTKNERRQSCQISQLSEASLNFCSLNLSVT